MKSKKLSNFIGQENKQDDPVVVELRATCQRLSQNLMKEKVRTGELVNAVFQAAKDALGGLSFKPYKPVAYKKPKHSTKEVAIINISDLQIGKVTATYSTEVCRERMNLLAEKVIRITNIQRQDHPVDEIVVNLLGDIVEGEMIFPGQAHLIDSSLYSQIVIDAPTILCSFIDQMLGSFKTVRVNGVVGNHGSLGGRARKEYNPTTNADRMVYRIIAERYRNHPRISFNIPDTERERAWYIVDYPVSNNDEQKYGVLLFHGDQVRGGGFGGFPFYGVAKRIWGWRCGAIKEPFQYAVFGHYHQATKITLNNIKVWCNGTSESDNTYAQEELSSMGEPSQLMLFMHPERGVTAEYEINLLQ